MSICSCRRGHDRPSSAFAPFASVRADEIDDALAMPERRQYERFELFAHVELRHVSKVETFVTINISAGGLLLRNDRNIEFSIGEQIRVAFDVPSLAPAFAIDATVVRVIGPTAKPALLAAMWTSSDPAAADSLAQILWNLRKI